jgi:hypothetical protein
MAAGNAVSATNGVTGVGGTEVQACVFRDSNADLEIQAFRLFYPLSPVTSLRCVPGCHCGFEDTFCFSLTQIDIAGFSQIG